MATVGQAITPDTPTITGTVTSYALMSALPAGLTLSTSTGTISGTPTGVAEQANYTVTASNSAGSTSAELQIVVAAAAPPPPVITTTAPLPSGTLHIAYSVALTATRGTTPYIWSVTGLPAGLSVDAGTGVISGTPTVAGTFAITIQAADSESTPQTATLSTNLVVNPSLAMTTVSLLPSGTLGGVYSAVLVASGGVTPYTWSLTAPNSLPAGLTLNAATGVISGIPTAAGTTVFTAQATDSSATPQVATAVYSFTITVGGLAITTSTPFTSGKVGTPYLATLAALGGMPPYAWSLKSGTLPAGLMLSSAGVLSGTPTAAGANSFTVQVSDAEATSVTAILTATLAINAANTVSIATPYDLPTGTANTAYDATLTANGGIEPYIWTVAGNLPAGLTLSSAGVLSGTPTRPGSSSFSIQVTDSEATPVTASLAATLVINPAPLAITTAGALPSGTVAALYAPVTLAATGGIAPYSWTISAGSLPAGLAVSSAGVISGTPTMVANNTVTIQVSDSASIPQTATVAATLIVSPTPGTIPDGYYAFLFAGTTSEGTLEPEEVAINGMFLVQGGVIQSGQFDENRKSISTPTPQRVSTPITGGSLTNGTDGIGQLVLNAPAGTITFALATPASVSTAGSDSSIRMIEFDDPNGDGTNGSGVLKRAVGIPTAAGILGNYAFLMSGSFSMFTASFVTTPQALVCGFQTNGIQNPDGSYQIPDGTCDANQSGGNYAHWPNPPDSTGVPGSYTIDTTGRGLLHIVLGNTTFTYSFYEVSPSEWFMVSIDPVSANLPVASGSVLQQTGSPFTAASLPTQSVVQARGIAEGNPSLGLPGPGVPDVLLGLVTSNGAGDLTFNYDEYNGTLNPNQSMTVAYADINPTSGRVVTAVNGSTPILYIINATSAFVLFPGTSALSGMLQAQSAGPFTNASFSGDYLGGGLPYTGPIALDEDGLVSADGNGNVTFLTNRSDIGLVLYQNVVGTYTVDATTGKVTVTTPDGLTRTFYVVSPTEVFYLTTDGGSPGCPTCEGGGYIGIFQQ